ncbi:MBL fold metallo-hydrolase [Zobellia galactanivorans]|uniref:MBL fold metallo-hydrolase n=1 Tax=Zobellia galactanivorans (strain DSM 12802 / CCUG 47099 / CIP 106680 / NCIMB 13871 / Dsij) TaxID=63186 RepID=UPI001C0675A9|nr:MBL fold metallo-hydrolase [Zobellia galactanivorans]MBU3024784.1 MBL fold metallo-hydrolase [Zobellia galactanivorans]MDO6808922.1 MBL fold metallo-hydrolase [Zobellia galactanivorans]
MLKRILRKVLGAFVILIGLLIVAYLLFNNFYPSLGGDVSKERRQVYEVSPQFKDGKFNNSKAVPKDLSFGETLDLAYKFFTTEVKNGRPKEDLEVLKLDSARVAAYKSQTRMVWFGHSSFLLQMEGKNILLDPMFGMVPAPHPWLGDERFNKEMPLDIEKLPQIDAVIFSHDHYDHLDYETILGIKDKVEHYFVPLGLGVHLEAWGISSDKITELDWWQEEELGDITLVCTPAQHFSGRKLNNGQSTLWGSWVVKSVSESIYFSGDSGYAPHFKEIGEKYGPFDLALMECGQYDKMWPDIHMMPEETAQAGLDVRAKKIMPIHWAGFKLALHDWKDPIIRVRKKAIELNVKVIAPRIGQEIMVADSLGTYPNWWKDL